MFLKLKLVDKQTNTNISALAGNSHKILASIYLHKRIQQWQTQNLRSAMKAINGASCMSKTGHSLHRTGSPCKIILKPVSSWEIPLTFYTVQCRMIQASQNRMKLIVRCWQLSRFFLLLISNHLKLISLEIVNFQFYSPLAIFVV